MWWWDKIVRILNTDTSVFVCAAHDWVFPEKTKIDPASAPKRLIENDLLATDRWERVGSKNEPKATAARLRSGYSAVKRNEVLSGILTEGLKRKFGEELKIGGIKIEQVTCFFQQTFFVISSKLAPDHVHSAMAKFAGDIGLGEVYCGADKDKVPEKNTLAYRSKSNSSEGKYVYEARVNTMDMLHNKELIFGLSTLKIDPNPVIGAER